MRSDVRCFVPGVEGLHSVIACCVCGTAAGGNGEAVSDDGLAGDKPLQSAGRTEPLHASFAFAERQMAVLCAIVQTFMGSMFKARCNLAFGGPVGSQFVRDDPFGQAKPLDQRPQKALCRRLVTLGLQDFLKNDPILVDRTPEPEFPSRDRHHDFVEMSDIPRPRLPSAQISGDLRGEFDRPPPDRLVGKFDTALQEHFFDLSQGKIETDIQPNHVRDQRRRKTMAFVTDGRRSHERPLPKPAYKANR